MSPEQNTYRTAGGARTDFARCSDVTHTGTSSRGDEAVHQVTIGGAWTRDGSCISWRWCSGMSVEQGLGGGRL